MITNHAATVRLIRRTLLRYSHGVRMASGCVPSALDAIVPPESQVGIGATEKEPPLR